MNELCQDVRKGCTGAEDKQPSSPRQAHDGLAMPMHLGDCTVRRAHLQGLLANPLELRGVHQHLRHAQLADQAVGLLHVACAKQSWQLMPRVTAFRYRVRVGSRNPHMTALLMCCHDFVAWHQSGAVGCAALYREQARKPGNQDKQSVPVHCRRNAWLGLWPSYSIVPCSVPAVHMFHPAYRETLRRAAQVVFGTLRAMRATLTKKRGQQSDFRLRIVPQVFRPARQSSSVLLPAPLTPNTAVISAGFRNPDTCRRTCSLARRRPCVRTSNTRSCDRASTLGLRCQASNITLPPSWLGLVLSAVCVYSARRTASEATVP